MLSILKPLILAWFITKFEPLKMVISFLPETAIKFMLQLLFGCLMCCSFWVTLITTNDIYLSSLSAFIGYWYNRLTVEKIRIN